MLLEALKFIFSVTMLKIIATIVVMIGAGVAFMMLRTQVRRVVKERRRERILKLCQLSRTEEALGLFLDSYLWDFGSIRDQSRALEAIRQLRRVVYAVSNLDDGLRKIESATRYISSMNQQLNLRDPSASGDAIKACLEFRERCDSFYAHNYTDINGYSDKLVRQCSRDRFGRRVLSAFRLLLEECRFKVIAARLEDSFDKYVIIEGEDMGILITSHGGPGFLPGIWVSSQDGRRLKIEEAMVKLGIRPKIYFQNPRLDEQGIMYAYAHDVADRPMRILATEELEDVAEFLKNNLGRLRQLLGESGSDD